MIRAVTGRSHGTCVVCQDTVTQIGLPDAAGSRRMETLLVLLVANALVWFVIAQGWP